MAFDYTVWPVVADVTATLAAANITLGAGVSADVKTRALNAAINKIVQKTGREFLSSGAAAIRYYDGTGTGKMVIDDYETITAVEFFQIPSSGTVSITNWCEVTNAPYHKNELMILQGPANMAIGWWTYFPQGRRNIKITGTFGWTSIPAQVWEAVCQEAAGRLADQARITPNGILNALHDLDQDFKWSDDQIKVMAGWKADVNEAISAWKRPLRQFLGRNKPVPI